MWDPVLYKCNKITRVLPCLLTAELGTVKMTQKHKPLINFSYVKSHTTAILPIPTTWHCNAMIIDRYGTNNYAATPHGYTCS